MSASTMQISTPKLATIVFVGFCVLVRVVSANANDSILHKAESDRVVFRGLPNVNGALYEDDETESSVNIPSGGCNHRSTSYADHDSVWEKHYENLYKREESATLDILNLYNCPVYTDRDGVQDGSYSLIPTEDTAWNLFDEAYRFARGIPAKPRTTTSTNKPHLNLQTGGWIFPPHRGIKIPFEVRYDPRVGRTLHALEFIPMDTTIWTAEFTVAFPPDNKTSITTTTATTSTASTASTASAAIPTFSSYRKFLEYLHTEYLCETTNNERTTSQSTAVSTHNWACDALMWTYQPGEATSLYMNFDHGALVNDGRGDKNVENLAGDGDLPEQILEYLVTEQGPLDCGVKPPTSNNTNTHDDYCDWEYMEFFAPQDILAGEELRYNYGLFNNNGDRDRDGDEEEEDDEEEEEEDDEEDEEDEYEYCGDDIACYDDDDDDDDDDDEDEDEYEYVYEITTVTD
jgi:hypothetical protein